jgi:hypothetical protein
MFTHLSYQHRFLVAVATIDSIDNFSCRSYDATRIAFKNELTMSVYQVGKLFFETQWKPYLQEEFKANPDELMGHYDLTQEEKTAILDKDVRALFKMGVPGLLLVSAGRQLLEVPTAEYRAALESIEQEVKG